MSRVLFTIDHEYAFSRLNHYLEMLNTVISVLSANTNTIYSTLQNKAQIPNFASQNTIQASLVYQNPNFNDLKQSILSIKTQSHIPFLINTKNSKSLNISRAQLTNIQKSFLAHSNLQFRRSIIQ